MTATVSTNHASTDLAVKPADAIAPAVPEVDVAAAANDAGRSVPVFSSKTNFESAQRMAIALSKSSLVPAAYRGQDNIPNVMIAMELANRISVSVFQVMQSLHIIQGKPGWSAQFLIATVNSSRRFTPLRFKWEGTPGKDDWGCRAYAKDREDGEMCLGALITMGIAKAEGWATKPGSKWRTMPEQMILYRAASFWTRVYAPELSLGMQTAEELADIGGVVDVKDTPNDMAPGDTQLLEAQLMNRGGVGAMPIAPETTEVVVVQAQDQEVPAKGKKHKDEPATDMFATSGDKK